MSPHQAIPDRTQVHVDRLLGSLLGEYRVLERVSEGRWGTIYRGQHASSGKAVTLEVLRAELTGNDDDANAANAIGCAGIATVSSMGQVPDGRRFRVMEPLEGESIDQVLQRGGRMGVPETLRVLDQVCVVLEAAHAWLVPHGRLRPSSVFLVNGAVKVIDFGLAGRASDPLVDLASLGAIGFALLAGKELEEGGAPQVDARVPAVVDRFLRDLLEQRMKDATSTRREIAELGKEFGKTAGLPLTPTLSPQGGRGRYVAVFVGVAVLGAGGVYWAAVPAPAPAPVVAVVVPPPVEEPALPLDEEPDEPETVVDAGAPTTTVERGPGPSVPRVPRAVPSARALAEQASRLEALLRKQARPGDDVDQALFVLNKQRLRLTGDPSVEDRKEVARQLAGWRRSYLRP